MALSKRTKEIMVVALADKKAGEELASAVDAGANAEQAQAAAVADLNQTISDPPTQAEVQAISDKIDELLAALRAAGLMAE